MAVVRDVLFIFLLVQKKITIQKANHELENITPWLRWWLPQSQGKHSDYNNSAVLLPLPLQSNKKTSKIITGSTKEPCFPG